ncbi:MAG: hypothetical protein GYA24_10920, partial [Candidatus Lokiarchaeota archaeon]|nr:hypothetical protein [Candidatus Lokiarchaeota archaeon]
MPGRVDMVRQGKKAQGVVRLKDIERLRKKRDIARSYELGEGSVAVLAGRYHASTRTVQEAIKHDAGWWQAQVGRALEAKQQGIPLAPAPLAPPVSPPAKPWFEQCLLKLVHLHGDGERGGYQVFGADGEPMAMVEGTINDVLAY